MTKSEFVSYIGKLAHEDMKKTGVLASVTAAQAILESAYGTSELAVNAHNLFGMKASLSGNNWKSDWNGQAYTKQTKEWDGKKYITISAPFRKYNSDAESIKDHSDYLTGAKNGTKFRYGGLVGETNPQKAAQIIKDGGYATSPTYVQNLCKVIDTYNLTQYDKQETQKVSTGINIIQSTGTNAMYDGARIIKYLVIHYTAGVTSRKGSARNTASWFRNPSCQGSADFIVDDAEIVQYNPDPKNHSCWAVGGNKYNNKGGRLYGVANNKNCISIEICSNNKTGRITNPNDSNWYFTQAAINNAIILTKYLMKLYSITPDRVIRHYDVNGKPCPGIIGWNADSGSETAWDDFKKKIGVAVTQTASVKVENKPNAVYRLYNSNGKDHMFTASAAERDNLIKAKWKYEGIAWYADPKGIPVYRAYNQGTGDHLLTVSKTEYENVVKKGWKGEGIAFRAKKNGRPVYRLYNSVFKSHHYTVSDTEKATLIKQGWKDEGRDFYA